MPNRIALRARVAPRPAPWAVRPITSGLALGLALLAGCSSAPTVAQYGHPALVPVAPPPVYHVVPAGSPDGQPVARYAEPADESGGSNAGRALLGAAAGAVIGDRFGGRGSNGQLAATVAGAAIGASVAQGQPALGATTRGALVGGVIGSRFGQGGGRDIATVIGAGIGAYMAAPDYKPANK
jgi:uncharacterized protein YcfJ